MRTHSSHSPRSHTLYPPLRGNLSSSTVSSSARSLFLLMNQLISNDFSTNFWDSRINIAEQCLWDWNFWLSVIPQRYRVQSVSAVHDWCADNTLLFKPKREGKQYHSLLQKKKSTIHSIVACLLIPLSPACIAHNENKAPSQGNNREYIFSPPLDMIASLGEPRPHIRQAYWLLLWWNNCSIADSSV